MKFMTRHIAALTLAVSFALTSTAQQLTVEKVALKQGDTAAQEAPCLDNNGNPCALVQIDAAGLQGLDFPNVNQYATKESRDGKYWVYIPDGMSKLSYGHESYARGDIDFKEWGYRRLKGGQTYLVQMQAPRQSELRSKVVFKVTPADAALSVDGTPCELDANGTCELSYAEGYHTYTAEKAYYDTENGSFTISGADARTVTVDMKPQMALVEVTCNKSSASVFVDDVYYGKPGTLMLPKGTHTLRVQSNRCLDYSATVSIGDSNPAVVANLMENVNQVDIHAVEVTIGTNSRHLYINNREVKNFKGSVMLMPDQKYRITDGYNHKRMVKVERDTPMIISM